LAGKLTRSLKPFREKHSLKPKTTDA
jgi:hypothetical protein